MADQYSKIHLQFSDDGTLNVMEQGTVSLQKQVRALRQELSIAAPEQQQQIRMALNQAELGLERTKAQSKELFGQLALLPGPMGRFAAEVQMSYIALRTLSQLSFKDIITDLKIMGDNIFGFTPKNVNFIPNANDNAAAAASGAGAAGASATTGASAAGAGAGTTAAVVSGQEAIEAATTKTTLAIDAQTQSLLAQRQALIDAGVAENAMALERTSNGLKVVSSYENIKNAQKDANFAQVDATNMSSAFYKEQLKAQQTLEAETALLDKDAQAKVRLALSNAQAAESEQALAAAEEETIVATEATNTSLNTLLTTLGELTVIVLALIGLFKLGELFIDWATGAREAAAANNELKISIKELNDVLVLDEQSAKTRQENRIAEMKAYNSSDKAIRQQNLKDVKENYMLVEKALIDSRENLNKAQKNISKEGGFLGLTKEESDKALKNYEDAQKQVIDLEKRRKDMSVEINKVGFNDIEIDRKNAYNNSLRDLDAKIQLEIQKENTQSKNLLALYAQRNAMIDKENALRGVGIQENEKIERAKQQRRTAIEEEVKDNVAKIDRLIQVQKNAENETTVGTAEYFAARREQIALELQKEIEQARTSEKHKQELIDAARSKNYKDNFELDKQELQAKITLAQLYFDNEYTNTDEAFRKKRELENAQYALRQKDAQGNYDKLEQLRLEHESKLDDIDKGISKKGCEC